MPALLRVPSDHRGRVAVGARAFTGLGRLAEAALAAMSLVYLGLLWLVACVPVVTAPTATVALVACVRGWSRGGVSPTARAFVRSIRVGLVARTTTMLIVVGLYAVLAIDLHVIGLMGGGRRLMLLGWFVVAIVVALLTVFVPAVLAERADPSSRVVAVAPAERAQPVAVLKRAAAVAVVRPHYAAAAVGVLVAAAALVSMVPLVMPVAAVAAAFGVDRLWDRAAR